MITRNKPPKTYYIYVLRHPITDFVFYVGKTTDPKRRLMDHCLCKANKQKYEYIQGFKITPIMEVLEEFRSHEEAMERERFYIKKLTQDGCELFNYGGNAPKPVKPLNIRVKVSPDMYELAHIAAKKRLITVEKLVELAIFKYYS